jgi:hypothetical protein
MFERFPCIQMIKEAAPILRRQKQDYEASFEVIGKLTSELNEARKVSRKATLTRL